MGRSGQRQGRRQRHLARHRGQLGGGVPAPHGRPAPTADGHRPLSADPLRAGVHPAAAEPRWLYAVDGQVRVAAATSNGQPDTQSWAQHSGAVYKTVLPSLLYDRPQRILLRDRRNPNDGYDDSLRQYGSAADLATAAEGWAFEVASNTLYVALSGLDLSVAADRRFQIVYGDRTETSGGEVGSEWVFGGATVILEGQFTLTGTYITNRYENGVAPRLYTEGRLTQLCPSFAGLYNEGFAFTSGRQCVRPRLDGLNGYGSSTNVAGMTIEHALRVSGTGDVRTFGTSLFPANCQATSAHQAHNVMIFGAEFDACFGQGVADISGAGNDDASWFVGVLNRDDYRDGGVSNGFYFDQSAGGLRVAYLDTCTSRGNSVDLVAIGSKTRLSNCDLPVQRATGGGTIAGYDPTAPG